jgi:hypothetical protein
MGKLNKTETLGEIAAYKIIYNYIDKTYGDDVPMTFFNVFAVKDYSAYWISINAPCYGFSMCTTSRKNNRIIQDYELT